MNNDSYYLAGNKLELYVKYKRKSQEDKNKQVASISSQERTFHETISFTNTQEPVADYEEEQSAKAPGRPKFNEMCQLLEQGKAKIIVCWALNRLARNPVDGGRIIWLVQNFGVKIVTPTQTYGIDDILLMYVEFGMSNKFITDLQKATKRGMDEKILAGHAPILAPIGYLNNTAKPQGLRDIIIDKRRFNLIRKMWDLLLDMQYSPPKILEIATNEWGLRRRNGRPLSDSQMYAMFGNIFYTGMYKYRGEILQGAHKQMITLEEFDKAQIILGRKGKPRVRAHEFPLTNLIKCMCASSITGTERFRKTCTNCHKRFNAQNYDKCPKCGTIAPQKVTHLIHYNCDKYLNPKCTQSGISGNDLERQIDELLTTLTIPQEFIDWTMDILRKDRQDDINVRADMLKNLKFAISAASRRLDNLSKKYFSEANKDGEILSDDEYIKLKNQYILERKQIEEKIKALGDTQDEWLDNSEKLFNFAKQARGWFEKGSADEKRAIVSALGINFVLKDKKLSVDLLKPIEKIQEAKAIMVQQPNTFEPEEKTAKSTQTTTFDPSNPIWGGQRESNPQPLDPQSSALTIELWPPY